MNDAYEESPERTFDALPPAHGRASRRRGGVRPG